MKTKILKLGFFLVLFSFVVTACDNDEVVPTEYEEQEFWKFSDFGCENQTWNLKPEYVNNYYIIRTQNDLEKYIQGECLPTIDFNDYFVIVGVKGFATGSSLFEEKVEENNVKIIYSVTFQIEFTQATSAVKYHVVLKKSSSKKEIVVIESID